jgi:nicotinate-nucleotide pyrophosphorylase (carboxylating)
MAETKGHWSINSVKYETSGSVDVPGTLLAGLMDESVRARIVATEDGVLAGAEYLAPRARELDLDARVHLESGQRLRKGLVIAVFKGNPVRVIRGEDVMLSLIGKASGIATAARRAVAAAGRVRVVCGGWKKMPLHLKPLLRAAIKAGGAGIRMLEPPFVYLDKNYIRMFGSVTSTLCAAERLPGRPVVIQLRGETGPIGEEVELAANGGAAVVMIDTGSVEDLREAAARLNHLGVRNKVRIAFSGGLTLDRLPALSAEDVDMIDVGRAIIDAPLLDFRYELTKRD